MALRGFQAHESDVVWKPLRNRPGSRKSSVDTTKPIVAQVGNLGSDYDEWVHDPVKRKESPRFFENNLLEFVTRCKWWMIPVIWGPLVMWCQAKAMAEGLSANLLPVAFTVGLIFWTFLEYILHRFLFHMKTSSYWTNKFHYVIHGFHHKHPMDGDRLVFPPLYTAAICSLMWWLMGLALPPTWKPSIFGGVMFGYIWYDLTHYFLHFGTPFTNHLYKMKKDHYNHHFKNGMQNYGFGVTSSLWDTVFVTLPPSATESSQPARRRTKATMIMPEDPE